MSKRAAPDDNDGNDVSTKKRNINRVDTDFAGKVTQLLGKAVHAYKSKIHMFTYITLDNFFKCKLPIMKIDGIPIHCKTPVAQLEKLVEQSLVGSGSSEILDLSVRNSLSSNANHKITFPHKYLSDVLGDICERNYIANKNLFLRFNKLIIYKYIFLLSPLFIPFNY